MKTRKALILLLITSSFLPILGASEEKKSSLYYAKLGATYPPGDSIVLPTFGIGARFQRDHYGLDLSANLGSILLINYASLKGTFLFYPQPEKKNQLYFGVGPGVGYYLDSIPMGHPHGSTSGEWGIVTVEGVFGYEFRHTDHFKTFVQLELSQPTFGFAEQRHHSDYRPGFALTAGFGF